MTATNNRQTTALIPRILLHEQTPLVDTILKEDREGEHLNHIQNLHLFQALLSDGPFIGCLSQLEKKLRQLEQSLEDLNTEDGRERCVPPWSTPEEMVSILSRDRAALDVADGRAREVYEWWLVPYWLSVKLEDAGEVVLRLFGNNWWGTTSYEEGKDKESILHQIAEDGLGFISSG